MRAAVEELTPIVGVKGACNAFDIPRASFYRKRASANLSPAVAAVRLVPRALDSAERDAVLACLHEERFQDSAPAAVYATLLDEGRYHCSIRTMYRILAGEGETRERRDQVVHPGLHRSRNCWPPARTNCGAGTSRSCWGRRSGRTSISTSSLTFSAVTWWAGWWRTARARNWPNG